MSEDIVITGMGIVSPIGCDEQAFWSAALEGRSGAAPVTGFDTSELPRKVACQVKEEAGEVAGLHMGRASRLAVWAAKSALASAGVEQGTLRGIRTSVIAGTTMGETEFIEERLSAGKEAWLTEDHARSIMSGRPGCISQNVVGSLLSGTEERVEAVDLYGACAAGNMALATARQRLLDGRCDVAIAGGADGFSHLAFLGFMRLRVMAANVCRPFDERRDGLFVGEGAVFFILERETSARARGARVRARLVGAGNACENYHPTRPHPDGDGLSRAIMAALSDAGIRPGEVEYVCAHGTGTPQNDAIEVAVMNKCFPSTVAFSSLKAITGHCMGAAAATEAALCVLSLEHQTLIPTWHLDNVLRPCELEALRGSPRKTSVRYVVNNSAGFGGYNSSIVLAAA